MSESRRPDPEHDDELADSFDIAEHARPGHTETPAEPADAAGPAESAESAEPAEPAEPAETDEPSGPKHAASTPAEAKAAAAEADDEPATPTGWRERRRVRKAKPRRKAPWWELPALVVLAILIAILVKTFVVQPFYIPSESMEKTLHGCAGCSGDRILVNKPIFDIRDPEPGDIVVFDAPKDWDTAGEIVPQAPSNPVVRAIRGFGQLIGFVPPDDLVLVKRVIAVGGQTIKGVSTADGGKDQVMISDNGPSGPWRTLHETYVDQDGPDDRADFGPVTVPKGRLWVMGDHRNASADSRYHCGSGGGDPSALGSCDPVMSTVPIDDVIGKAFVIAWPPSRWRTLGTPSTFEDAAAASGVLPLGVVLPVFLIRRRRRRPRRAVRE